MAFSKGCLPAFTIPACTAGTVDPSQASVNPPDLHALDRGGDD